MKSSRAGYCWWGTSVGVLAVLFLASSARSQSVQRPYVNIDATLLSADSGKVEIDTELASSQMDSSEKEVEESTTTFGLLGSGIGIGIGVGVSDNVVLGGQVRFTSQRSEIEDETVLNTRSWILLPRVEYVFSTDGAARPYLVALAGLSSIGSEAGERKVSELRTLVGAGFGAHLFAAPSFSIDPQLAIARYGGKRTITDPQFDSIIGDDTLDFSVSGTMIWATVSFTAWFGDGPAPRGSESSIGPAVPAPALAAAGDGSFATPAPASPPPSPADDEQVPGPEPLKKNLLLAGDRILFVKGRPESLRTSVMFRISDAPGGAALSSCRDVAIVSGQDRYPARNLRLLGKRAVGRELRALGEGLFTIEALQALVRDPEAVIVVCNERWVLTDAATQGLNGFLDEFQLRSGASTGDASASPSPSPRSGPDTAETPGVPSAVTPSTPPAPSPAPRSTPTPPAPPPPRPTMPSATPPASSSAPSTPWQQPAPAAKPKPAN